MALIKYQNQSDYAFLVWMGSFPDSAHPLDERRFCSFAKTVAVYRNKKWLDYDFFKESILNHPKYFDEEKIEEYWRRLLDFIAFHRASPIPTVGIDSSGDYGRYQVGVKKGKSYRVRITQEEYFGGGASKETMQNAEYF